MQFLLTAFDGKDKSAQERRLLARPGHLENIRLMKRRGEFIFGGAILDDQGQMIGSTVVYEFPDRKALDNYLEGELYVTKGVWKEIEIRPFAQAIIEQNSVHVYKSTENGILF
jgi:uncharacterized protein